MKTIKQTYHIMAPLDRVWQALVDPQIIRKWSGDKAVMDDKVGTKFSLWGGSNYGTNLKVIKHKKLVQDWYYGNWPKPSKATFTLTHKDGCTAVHLLHENVPDDEASNISDGWNLYYLGEIKKQLESS